jgi:hypothetical protein
MRSNIYSNPVIARLVRDGIEGTGNAWRRWTRRPDLRLIDGGRHDR